MVTGPSGVGKSTIVREVVRRTGSMFSVSVTTRRPRDGEQDGREYRFVDRPAFQEMIRRGQLLEWAEVFGRLYGTPAEPVQQALAAGETMLLDVDIQGGLQIHRAMPQAEFVLVVPPGRDELARRIRRRGSESPQQLQDRLAKAQEEIAAAVDSGVYNHQVINDDLETAVRKVTEIVSQERCQR